MGGVVAENVKYLIPMAKLNALPDDQRDLFYKCAVAHAPDLNRHAVLFVFRPCVTHPLLDPEYLFDDTPPAPSPAEQTAIEADTPIEL